MAAQERLARLLQAAGADCRGFRFDGYIGSCRGSTPLLRPAVGPSRGDTEERCGGVLVYVPSEYAEVAAQATLDFEPSFMGRGLHLSWPHRRGCQCDKA